MFDFLKRIFGYKRKYKVVVSHDYDISPILKSKMPVNNDKSEHMAKKHVHFNVEKIECRFIEPARLPMKHLPRRRSSKQSVRSRRNRRTGSSG